MAHSFTNLLYHIVFATKHREPVLEESWRPDLLAFLGKAISDLGGIALIVNGLAEHIHLFAKLRPDEAVSDVLRTIKARSSAWIHKNQRGFEGFAWQSGYGAFTVSQSQAPRVKSYVKLQEQHHRSKSFDIEFRELLRKNGCDVDESFYWE